VARIIWAIAITALVVLFAGMAAANWGEAPVAFVLPNGDVAPIRLPLLLALAVLAGWLPMFLWHMIARAGLKRRLVRLEGPVVAQAPVAPSPSSARVDMAQPTIVPPAGA
jgi:hypothetical protein